MVLAMVVVVLLLLLTVARARGGGRAGGWAAAAAAGRGGVTAPALRPSTGVRCGEGSCPGRKRPRPLTLGT